MLHRENAFFHSLAHCCITRSLFLRMLSLLLTKVGEGMDLKLELRCKQNSLQEEQCRQNLL